MDDEALLREYAVGGSEAAFRALVERYIPLVYGAALRQLGNGSMAEDVTQAVFIILARKAASLPRGIILSGWLYRATRFTAEKARRTEYRREQREREAVQLQSGATDTDWSQLAPVLDDAIAQLREGDRTVILLRFFENQSLKDVGRAMGISEDTAQKRVSRAVDKLRGLLAKEGVVVSAVAMTTAISTHVSPVVSTQLNAAATAAGLGHGIVSAAVQNLARAPLRPWTSVKTISSGVAALIILVIALFISLHHSTRHPPRPAATSPRPGVAQITVRVRQQALRPPPGPALIRFSLIGTPGLKFEASYSRDGQIQTTNGVLPGEILFQADTFTMTMTAHGPGDFGFQAYRNDRLMGWSSPASVVGANTFEIEGMARGQGLRFRQE